MEIDMIENCGSSKIKAQTKKGSKNDGGDDQDWGNECRDYYDG